MQAASGVALTPCRSVLCGQRLGQRSKRRQQAVQVGRQRMAVHAELSVESLAREACSHFMTNTDLTFAPTSGGVNNVVFYVTAGDGAKSILRIYNNGFNNAKVAFEHAVLSQLASKRLSILLPLTIPTLKDPSKSFVKLSNGADAAMFELIPGVLPKNTLPEEIGRASGELSRAMADVSVPLEPPIAPYFDIYRVHHAVTREKFFEYVKGDAFAAVREPTAKLVAELLATEASLESFHALNLPKQLIHGDLHYDNVLVEGGRVTGLLDFEFCALDWRAMELAICLSKYAGEPEPFPYFEKFVSGFAVHGRLTPAEVQALPALINLRILSNVVYFVGRALADEDSIDSLTKRAQTYADRVAWVKTNASAISALVASKVKSD